MAVEGNRAGPVERVTMPPCPEGSLRVSGDRVVGRTTLVTAARSGALVPLGVDGFVVRGLVLAVGMGDRGDPAAVFLSLQAGEEGVQRVLSGKRHIRCRRVCSPNWVRRPFSMSRLLALLLSISALLCLACPARQPLPSNASPPKDQAELESRYERLQAGIAEPEIAAFMGKAGAEVAGYSTSVVKRKPESGSEMAAGETDK